MSLCASPVAWRIRPGTKSEIPHIESVLVAAYAQYRDEAPAAIFNAYVEDLQCLADYWDEAEILVAERDGRIWGAVLFYADASSEGLGLPSTWSGFRKLAVDPAMRSCGLGRRLTEECIARARALGAESVGIHTASFMQAACRIYEQSGFRRRPEYDLRASEILGVAEAAGDVAVIAYHLDLASSQAA